MKKLIKTAIALLCAVAMLATSLNGWNQMKAVQASDTEQTETTTVTPVELEGFRTITTKNFVDASGNVMGDKSFSATSGLYSLVDDEGKAIDSYDHTLLTMKLNFGTSGVNAYARIEFAGKDTSTGFKFFAQNDTRFQFNNLAGSSSDKAVHKDAFTYFDVTSAVNKDVLVQISTEYGNFDDDNTVDDIKMNFYFDGNLYTQKTLTDCKMENLGNCFRVYIYSTGSNLQGPITISSPVQEEETTTNDFVTLDGFRTITPTNFISTTNGYNMGNSTTFSANSDTFALMNEDGTLATNFDKTLLSMKVKFSVASTSGDLEIHFGGSTGADGVRIYSQVQSNGTNRVLIGRSGKNTYPTAGFDGVIVMDDVTEEFNLQISTQFERDDSDSITKIVYGLYLNGQKISDVNVTATTNGINEAYLGNSLRVMATSTKTLKISSIVEQKFVTMPGFTTVTASNFRTEGGEQIPADAQYNTRSFPLSLVDDEGNKVGSLDKTILTLKLKFGSGGNGSNERLEFGGKQYSDTTNGLGFMIAPDGDGTQLLFNNCAAIASVDKIASSAFTRIKASNLEIDQFLNDGFIIQIGVECGDFNDGGTANDIRVYFYINGQLHKDSSLTPNGYMQMLDCNMDNFGGCMRIYCTSEVEPVTISSVPCRYGDTNPNGATDIRDLIATVKASEGLALKHTTGSLGADVDKNNAIDLDDILVICKKLLQR